MNDIKILACGGRHFNEYDMFSETINPVFNELGIRKNEIELASKNGLEIFKFDYQLLTARNESNK